MGKFFRDIFMSPGNKAWDISRISGIWALASYSFAFLYALIAMKNVPDWFALGGGYGLVMAGAAAFLGVKDAMFGKIQADAAPKVTVAGDLKTNTVGTVNVEPDK